MLAKESVGRVSDAIVQLITREMSEGRWETGRRLPPERDMARQFNASRVSVREAYRTLEKLGLVAIRRGKEGGTFVVDLNYEPVRRSLSLLFGLNQISHAELSEARLLLEPLVARLAALRARPDDIARMEVQLGHEAAVLARPDGEVLPSHSQFHGLIAECARNVPLKLLVTALADLTTNAAATLDPATRTRHQRKNWQFHRLLFLAIQRHDEEMAYTIMMRHISSSQRRVRRSINAGSEEVASPREEQPGSDMSPLKNQ